MVGRLRSVALVVLPLVAFVAGCELLGNPHLHASLSASPPVYKGPGPVSVSFTGKITVNMPCDVKYRIVRSDGISTPSDTLHFDTPGHKDVSKSWTFTTAWKGFAKIQIEAPEWAESKAALFTANIHSITVTLTAVPPFHKGPGAFPVTFHGVITTTKAMDVTYTFVRSDGTPTVAVTKNFPAAGPHPVSEVRVFAPPSVGWEKLKVLSPETVESAPAPYQVIP